MTHSCVHSNLLRNVDNIICSLYREGLMDRNFNYLEPLLKQFNNAVAVFQIIDSYFAMAEESIEKLTSYMSEPVINFVQVKDAATNLMCSSSGVGVCRVVQACKDLVRACDDNNKDRCLESFERIKHEYDAFSERLDHLYSSQPDPVTESGRCCQP